jgi:hypothetical protein
VPGYWYGRRRLAHDKRPAGAAAGVLTGLRDEGLNEQGGPLSPTAHTIAAPELVATAPTPSVLPVLGMATTFHSVPFQFSMSVW